MMEQNPSTSYLESDGRGIGHLLMEMANISKKVTLDSDLSKVLDDFLNKLNNSDLFLAHGIASVNFAEAALLLQTSADIYGKKVDLLWNLIIDHQKRLVRYNQKRDQKEAEENASEIEKLDERQRKYKRKKKTTNVETLTKLINDFSFHLDDNHRDNHDALTHEYESADLLGEWTTHFKQNHQRSQNQRIFVNKNAEFLPENEIYSNEDNEYLGRYNQFISSSLLEEIFCLDDNNLLKGEDKCVSRIRIDSYVINNFLWERSIPCTAPLESYIDDLKQYVSNFLQNQGAPCAEKDGYEEFNLSFRNLNRKRCFVTMERLPVDVVQEKLRRISTADSMFDDNISFTSCGVLDHEKAPENGGRSSSALICSELDDSFKLPELPGSLEKRNQSCSQDSAFYDEDDMDLSSSFSPSLEEQTSPISSPILVLKRTCLQAESKGFYKEDFVGVRKIKRISKKERLMTLATGITADLNNFEKFFCKQYKSAEGEGEPPQLESEPEDSDHDMDNDENVNESEQTEFLSEHLEEELVLNDPEEIPEENATTSSLFSVEETTEALEEEASSSMNRPSQLEIERQDASYEKVREWKKFILPKLREASDKAHFDIHEYSAEIIEGAEIGEKFYFKNLVSGKSPSDVARFFLATLSLANTKNIEISGAQSGAVSNDTFQVKVLDKTRHHELLEEYHAPSEDAFLEKLEQVKALNPQVILHSTPYGPPPVKKAKMEANSKKKLFH